MQKEFLSNRLRLLSSPQALLRGRSMRLVDWWEIRGSLQYLVRRLFPCAVRRSGWLQPDRGRKLRFGGFLGNSRFTKERMNGKALWHHVPSGGGWRVQHDNCLDDKAAECLGNTREGALDPVQQATLTALAFGFDLGELHRSGARRRALVHLLVSLVRLNVVKV